MARPRRPRATERNPNTQYGRRTNSVKHVGHFEHGVSDVSALYHSLATSDESAGEILRNAGAYRQAAYFFVQAMEKYVRREIFRRVNAKTDWFREKTITHELEDLIDFLIEILSTDQRVRTQIKKQLYDHVLGGVRFARLHNNLRYPFYSSRHKNYSRLIVGASDAELAYEKLSRLKKFLDDLHMLRG